MDHLYAFFLRWTPDRSGDSVTDGSPMDTNSSSNPGNCRLSSSQSKPNENSTPQGFVLLANDDPELTDDYLSSKNKTKPTTTPSDPSSKKQHYLKRQNTLLKEWEVSERKQEFLFMKI